MKVLFVCTANINRSQIAEAIFNRLSRKNHATSAGLRVGRSDFLLREAHNNPVIPMMKEGYNLSKARIKRLNKKRVDSAGKVVILYNKERRLKEMPRYLQGRKDLERWKVNSISDETPFDEYCKLEKRRIGQINKHVKELVQRIG